MAKYTENYNLILPEQSEDYNVDVANTNNKEIDSILGNKADKIPGKGLSTNDFTNEYKKKIDSLQTLYRFKGNVETIEDLKLKDNNIGDVWRCEEDGNNYCWNKEEWVNIGTDMDLSQYALKADLDFNKEETDKKFIEIQNNINQTKEDMKDNYYTKTLTENLTNTELEIPAPYKVGTNCLQVYFEGDLLEKDIHYEEVGEANSISNKIKIDWLTNWKEETGEEELNFSFIVQGTYEEASV